MRPFRDLHVWHKAHALTLQINQATEHFPRTETFGMSAQLRRTAMLVSMKIAEGCGYDTSAQYTNCLQQSRAASVDLEYVLLLARDLRLLDAGKHDSLHVDLVEVRKMLSGVIRAKTETAI